MKRNALFLSLIVFSISLIPISQVSAQDEWDVYETNCCTIQYPKNEYLRNFTLRIGGFKFTSKGLDDNPSNVKKRIDEIMEKVQFLLDMHPSDLHISILLYPDHPVLGRIFRRFSQTGDVPLAFYTHKTKSIYVDVSGVTDGVLGHEMAHAVISFYFGTPPPAKMQEILAQYVDLHLWD